MTDQEFLNNLNADKRFWWEKMVKKHGSVQAVKDQMSEYTSRRETVGGFTDRDLARRAAKISNENRKK